ANMNSVLEPPRGWGCSRGRRPAFRTDATNFAAPSLRSPPTVATAAPPNIACASTTSSFLADGRARCRCSTRARHLPWTSSTCESRIPAERRDLTACTCRRRPGQNDLRKQNCSSLPYLESLCLSKLGAGYPDPQKGVFYDSQSYLGGNLTYSPFLRSVD